jgi:hypothetical protein
VNQSRAQPLPIIMTERVVLHCTTDFTMSSPQLFQRKRTYVPLLLLMFVAFTYVLQPILLQLEFCSYLFRSKLMR